MYASLDEKERKGREEQGKERERERRKEGVSLSPVFYTFITCLALVILDT